jgi:hypothetical protein
MNNGNRARELGIANVRIKSRQLIRTEHPLVNHRARGKARHVTIAAALNLAQRRFNSFSDHEERYFEACVAVDIALHAHSRDEYLSYDRTRAPRRSGQYRVVDRNVAPAKHGASFLRYRFFNRALARETSRATSGEEQHADSVTTCVGQCNSDVRAGAPKKNVGHLKQNARAITGAGVSRDSASVRKIPEKLERLLYNVARANAMDVRDKPNSARVMFVGRVV